MDKRYYQKQIVKHLAIILLASIIVGLWFYLSEKSLIPFADSIKAENYRGPAGMLILVVSIVLILCYVVAILLPLYKVGLLVYELLIMTTTSNKNQLTTDISANNGAKTFNMTSHLNKQMSVEVRNAIVQFYNDNIKNRNKGLLLACVIEYMCDKGWLNEIEPGYPSLEDFFKNDLGLDSVGFQQLDKSHDELKKLIRDVNMYNEGKAQEPKIKDFKKVEQYEKFVNFMEESNQ